MNESKTRQVKIDIAWKIVNVCLAPGFGVYASPDRYLYQCWTRDLALAIAPLLLAYGYVDIVRDHLLNLCMRQGNNGKIPILFLSDEKKWRAKKVAERGENSFMVGRFDAGELGNLTPGTKDSEILFIIAMHEYAYETDDWSLMEEFPNAIDQAMKYVVDYNMIDNGMVIGADWRDTMEKQLASKALLTNNALLVKALEFMDMSNSVRNLKTNIIKYFVRKNSIIDYLSGGDRPDPLGISLAVLYDVIPREMYPMVRDIIESVDTKCGVTIKCIHNPYSLGEEDVFAETRGEVVWPFVVGFTAIALEKMDYHEKAEQMLQKMEKLNGFYEFYDPRDGKGYGAKEQLWSAALYLRANDYVRGID
jgi:hypothetical protein